MLLASIALFILVIFLCLTIYIFKRRKVYSRERFAFVSLGLLFSFAALVITHVFTDWNDPNKLDII